MNDQEPPNLNQFNWFPDTKERVVQYLTSNKSAEYLNMLSSQLLDVPTQVTANRLTNFLQNVLRECGGVKTKKQAKRHATCSFHVIAGLIRNVKLKRNLSDRQVNCSSAALMTLKN